MLREREALARVRQLGVDSGGFDLAVSVDAYARHADDVGLRLTSQVRSLRADARRLVMVPLACWNGLRLSIRVALAKLFLGHQGQVRSRSCLLLQLRQLLRSRR